MYNVNQELKKEAPSKPPLKWVRHQTTVTPLSLGEGLGVRPVFFFILVYTLFIISTIPSCSQENIRLQKLTCEYAVKPLGIDSPEPILGWQIISEKPGMQQTAYRILVASSEEQLKNNVGDVWDTGKKESSESQQIKYAGPPLRSTQYYYWKVQVWDENDRLSSWSQPSVWSMGMLDAQEWKGMWISGRYSDVSLKREYIPSWGEHIDDYRPTDTAAVYMRKTIDAPLAVKRATAFISGLGYYELYINGDKVGDAVMDPAFTDYQRLVGYSAYDLTSMVKKGKNAIGIILGNGFYNLPAQDLFQMQNAHWKTPPKVRMNLLVEYESDEKETIVTDGTWKWNTGEIVFNCIRGGETIDHRLYEKGWNTISFNDDHWSPVVEVPAPVGELKAQILEPMRVNEVVKPIAITEPRKGVYLVDFGKNITGWIELTITGKKDQSIICDYNEHLKEDGTLDLRYSHGHTHGRFQQEQFILNGEGAETFEPRFTYHGFRYVQLEGLAEKPDISSVLAKGVFTPLDTTGYFYSSDNAYNSLQKAIVRTYLNSTHGLIAEEPTREKMGWTLDAGVAVQSYLYNFNAVNALKKCIQDYIDAQEPSGHIAPILPTNGWGYVQPDGTPFFWDDPWWGGSLFLLVGNLYKYTGDTTMVAHAFDAMKRYADFLATTAVDDMVDWSLGDWLDVNHNINNDVKPGLTPVIHTGTVGYYWMNERVSAYARMLGKNDIANQYAANAERIKDKYNVRFLDRETGWYEKNSQTAQALPLWTGMVPEDMKEKVTARLLDAVRYTDGHISAGFIGSIPVLECLSENGYMDIAFEMVDKREIPGWFYMVKDENSTMGESLNSKSTGTGHHPYGAHIGFWLFKYLGGIRIDQDRPGYKTFIIEPYFPAGMNELCTTTESLYGKISSSWKRDDGGIKLALEIPANTSVEFVLSTGYTFKRCTLSGEDIEINPVKSAAGKAYYNLSSGLSEFYLQNIR